MLTCRVFAEIHEKSRNNVADHTVPANVLLTDKLEFSCIDYDLSLGSFSLILVRYTKVLTDSELPG